MPVPLTSPLEKMAWPWQGTFAGTSYGDVQFAVGSPQWNRDWERNPPKVGNCKFQTFVAQLFHMNPLII